MIIDKFVKEEDEKRPQLPYPPQPPRHHQQRQRHHQQWPKSRTMMMMVKMAKMARRPLMYAPPPPPQTCPKVFASAACVYRNVCGITITKLNVIADWSFVVQVVALKWKLGLVPVTKSANAASCCAPLVTK
jgi:hypothetical protein